MANNIPSRIKIDESKAIKFQELRDNFSKKIYNSDIFALALAYGYKSEVRIPIDKKRDFINMVSVSDELKSLILFIGLVELGDEVIENPALMYEIAEEYANAGIDELYNDFNENFDEFTTKMLNDLMRLNENFDFNKISGVLE